MLVEDRVPIIYGFLALTLLEDMFVLNIMPCPPYASYPHYLHWFSYLLESLFIQPDTVKCFWYIFACELWWCSLPVFTGICNYQC